MTETIDTVFAVGDATCSACGFAWIAIAEELEAVPLIAGLECPRCARARGRWLVPRARWPKEIEAG